MTERSRIRPVLARLLAAGAASGIAASSFWSLLTSGHQPWLRPQLHKEIGGVRLVIKTAEPTIDAWLALRFTSSQAVRLPWSVHLGTSAPLRASPDSLEPSWLDIQAADSMGSGTFKWTGGQALILSAPWPGALHSLRVAQWRLYHGSGDHPTDTDTQQLVWLVCIVLVPVAGACAVLAAALGLPTQHVRRPEYVLETIRDCITDELKVQFPASARDRRELSALLEGSLIRGQSFLATLKLRRIPRDRQMRLLIAARKGLSMVIERSIREFARRAMGPQE